ncbi:MAG: hypothetical protein PHX83_08600 [Acidobacteriia bacterium]|nr:hypothetical protein [Terriglobia bacterium]
MRIQRKIAGLVVAGALLFGISGTAWADRGDHECHERVEKAERNLDKAIRRHGPNSHQAFEKREQLRRAQERCGQRFRDGRYDRQDRYRY